MYTNRTCVGWTSMKNCGRSEQVVAPGAINCPDITWFYVAAVAIAIAALGGR
jgi:hypothetical protein